VLEIFKHLGAERMVGPPPPGEAERDLKGLITDLRAKLGLNSRPAKRGAKA
jgi:hypothetical protein